MIRVRATAASGQAAYASRTVSLDTDPPRSRASVRLLGAAAEITLEAADEVSGVDALRWRAPGTFWATYQEPFTRVLTDSEQVVEFCASDRAGNREAVRRVVLPPAPERRASLPPGDEM